MKNRIRRQREIKKNFLILFITFCLIAAGSVSFSGFRSNARNHVTETSTKYYKSIIVRSNDTLWSIAEQYMDAEHYGSISDYVEEVKWMNSLENDDIHYGEYLIVSYYD